MQREFIRKLKKFLIKLSKYIKVDKVILFGSRVEGNYDKNSDVDLIIVSEDFAGKNFFERASIMYNYGDIDLPVDFLCYTNKEFNNLKNKITIVSESLKKGIVLN